MTRTTIFGMIMKSSVKTKFWWRFYGFERTMQTFNGTWNFFWYWAYFHSHNHVWGFHLFKRRRYTWDIFVRTLRDASTLNTRTDSVDSTRYTFDLNANLEESLTIMQKVRPLNVFSEYPSFLAKSDLYDALSRTLFWRGQIKS